MDSDAQELLRLEDELAQVVVGGDPRPLARILDDTYVFTNAAGEVKSKAEVIAGFEELVTQVRFDSIENSDMRVTVYGDAAVVSGVQTQSARYKDKDVSGRYRFTSFYVRRRGEWRAVAAHVSSAELDSEL